MTPLVWSILIYAIFMDFSNHWSFTTYSPTRLLSNPLVLFLLPSLLLFHSVYTQGLLLPASLEKRKALCH